jgi:hypothetical protein
MPAQAVSTQFGLLKSFFKTKHFSLVSGKSEINQKNCKVYKSNSTVRIFKVGAEIEAEIE